MDTHNSVETNTGDITNILTKTCETNILKLQTISQLTINNKSLVDIIYPVGSVILLARTTYDPNSITGTKWVKCITNKILINYPDTTALYSNPKNWASSLPNSSDNKVLHYAGDEYISYGHLPDHSHKGIIGWAHGFDRNKTMQVIDGDGDWVPEYTHFYTSNEIGLMTNNNADFTTRGTQQKFDPFGIDVAVWVRTA